VIEVSTSDKEIIERIRKLASAMQKAELGVYETRFLLQASPETELVERRTLLLLLRQLVFGLERKKRGVHKNEDEIDSIAEAVEVAIASVEEELREDASKNSVSETEDGPEENNSPETSEDEVGRKTTFSLENTFVALNALVKSGSVSKLGAVKRCKTASQLLAKVNGRLLR